MFKKLYVFLFKKPNIKIGDKLIYYSYTCKSIHFNWQCGLWFVKCEETELNISYGLELWAREQKEKGKYEI